MDQKYFIRTNTPCSNLKEGNLLAMKVVVRTYLRFKLRSLIWMEFKNEMI